VAVDHLNRRRNGQVSPKVNNGTLCPMVTGLGKVHAGVSELCRQPNAVIPLVLIRIRELWNSSLVIEEKAC